MKKDIAGGEGTAVIAVGDPTVIDFQVLPNPRMIRVVGRRAGVTDLSITTADGQAYSFEVHVVYDLPLLRAQLKQMLQCNIYPIIVEHTPEQPALAAARRDHVLNLLAKLDFPIPQDWVVVGEPVTRGLHGTEAVGIDQKMLQSIKPGTKTTETSVTQSKQKTTEEPPTR